MSEPQITVTVGEFLELQRLARDEEVGRISMAEYEMSVRRLLGPARTHVVEEASFARKSAFVMVDEWTS